MRIGYSLLRFVRKSPGPPSLQAAARRNRDLTGDSYQAGVFLAYRLRVLGPPEVLDADENPVSLSHGKPMAVLIYVACASSPVSRDELADLLWPDADRQKGRHSVRQALWVLKNALGDDIFDGNEPLSIRHGTLEVDLRDFADALKAGRVDEARAHWRGPLLDHFVLAGVRQWNHWAEDLRGDLEHRFCKALLAHARGLAGTGDTVGALSALGQAIEVAPSSEAPHLARIELLLDLLRLDAAREAIADAHRALGDHEESQARLSAMEERLAQVVEEQRARVEEGESFPMEFVGRSRELAGLQSLWREAHTGLTRTAVVTGPSGIGKTRLAQELMSFVAGQDVRTVALKGTRVGMKLRWACASDLARGLLRLPGSAGISSASDSLLRAMLPSLGKGGTDARTVNGMSPAPFLDAISDLLEAVSFETPLVILVDDFQWLDRDSRSLLMGLASRCRELRILFLILGRSDLSSRHWEEIETTLVSEAGARRFLLEPLIEEEVGELLALGAAFPNPEEAKTAVQKIFQASAGNPLFIREILKELHEEQILVRDGPGWVFQTSEIPDTFEIPESLRVLLQERLDRLSEAGANLAATLAKASEKTPPDILQRETQLPGGVFGKAMAELLERGVIEWVDGTNLDFVHDVLRDTAASHLSGSLPDPIGRGGRTVRWTPVTGTAFFTVLAVVIGFLSLDEWWPAEQAPPPPYGGGTIVLLRGKNPIRALPITSGPAEEWIETDLSPSAPEGTRRVFRRADGGFLWIGVRDHEDGPDVERILDNGTKVLLAGGPGDQSLQDVSPEGNRLLFLSENLDQDRFSHSLYWTEIEGSQKRHQIYEGTRPLGLGRFSPDGDLVAFSIVDASDSLAIYSLDGERLFSQAFGEIRAAAWCGDGIVISASPHGTRALFHVDPWEETFTELTPSPFVSGGVTCSPDGTMLLHTDMVAGRPMFVLRNLETGEITNFPNIEVRDYTAKWIPPEATSVPLAVATERDTIRLEFGERTDPKGVVLYSDGSQSTEGIWWEALNPEVASITPENILVGNRAGVGRVVTRWGHSLKDTTVVVVRDSGGGVPGAFFRGDWSKPLEEDWLPYGNRPPIPDRFQGELVLRLMGTEKYHDGLLFRDPIPLDQGVTIEVEFQMELTRDVHQNVGLCLQDQDFDNEEIGTGALWGAGEEICIRYPSREMEKLDPTEVSLLVTPGVEILAQAPESLPPKRWTHLAIQVRPDGECSLVVDRERVGTCPIRIPTTPVAQWTVKLDGDAVGTDLYVRSLNIWTEVRY